MILNLGLNLILPTLLLLWGGEWLGLPPWLVLVLALLGPLGFGSYELLIKRKVNHVSILGVISVVLTGGIGLLQLDAGWIAVKEAAVPLVFGAILLISAFTPWPVLQTLLLDAEILDVPRVDAALEARQTRPDFTRAIRLATFGLSASFVLSAVAGYALAAWIVHSPSGSEAFNQELGQLTAWSFPVIGLPSMVFSGLVMWWMLRRLGALTGLTLDEMVGGEPAEPST